MAKIPLKSVHPDAIAALLVLGQSIRQARQTRGDTQTQAAERIGAHVQTVGRIEKGEPGVTSGHLLGLLAVYAPELLARLTPASGDKVGEP